MSTTVDVEVVPAPDSSHRGLIASVTAQRLWRKLPRPGNFAGTTICNFLSILCGACSGVVLARSLGPGRRGELAVSILWPSTLVLFSDLGLGLALSFYVAKFRERISELWTLGLLVGVSVGGGMALTAWAILPHLTLSLTHATISAMRIVLAAVPLMIITAYQSYILLGVGLVAEFNFARLAPPVTHLLTVLAVAATGHASVRAYAIAYVIAKLMSLAASLILLMIHLGPRLRFNTELLPRLLSYGTKTQMSNLAFEANSSFDQNTIGLVLPPQMLGLYAVAVSISGVLGPFLNSLSIVILPRTIYADSNTSGALIAARSVKLAALLSIPVLAFSLVIMPWALPMLFGQGYSAAVPAAQILLVAGLFQGLNAVLSNSLRGLGRPSQPAVAQGIGFVITLGALFLMLRPLGIVGAAIASLLTYFAVTMIQLAFLAKAANMSMLGLLRDPLDISPLIGMKRWVRALVRF